MAHSTLRQEIAPLRWLVDNGAPRRDIKPRKPVYLLIVDRSS